MELIKVNQDEYSPVMTGHEVYALKGVDKSEGLIIGNALRRVLLSSMPGCAISRINISGVTNEFDAAPGVHEDVSVIIMNLKEVVLSTDRFYEGETLAVLDVSGPADVKAGDINVLEPFVRVCNPEKHLFFIEEGSSLQMTLTITCGRGCSLSNKREKDSSSIGDIEIDALYNPVQNVVFEVVPEGSGHTLYVGVKTNGATDVEFLLAHSARILQDFFNILSDPKEIKQASLEKRNKRPVVPLSTTIEELYGMGLSPKVVMIMKRNKIVTLGDILQCSKEDLFRLRGFGPVKYNVLNEFLVDIGAPTI